MPRRRRPGQSSQMSTDAEYSGEDAVNKRQQGPMATDVIQEWKPFSFPYTVHYKDHFETPLRAFQDIKPLLLWLGTQRRRIQEMIKRNDSNLSHRSASSSELDNSDSPVLYDPYYCNGQSAVLLRRLGFPHVLHEKRDFYKDVARYERQKKEGSGSDLFLNRYDILVTNPPYSGDHKQRCLQFCIQQLKNQYKPFCLLLPSYIALRQYYRDCLQQLTAKEKLQEPNRNTKDEYIDMFSSVTFEIVYLVPVQTTASSLVTSFSKYEYQHPEGTGKDTCPFDSIWYCGLAVPSHSSLEKSETLQSMWRDAKQADPSLPELILSVDELELRLGLTDTKRPNPRQRRKRKQSQGPIGSNEPTSKKIQGEGRTVVKPASSSLKAPSEPSQWPSTFGTKKQSSKYRGADGKRTKRRF